MSDPMNDPIVMVEMTLRAIEREATDLLANSHLRVISVGDMEIYMQGLTFRALECDEVRSRSRETHHQSPRGRNPRV